MKGAKGREGKGRPRPGNIDTHGTSWNEIEFGVLIQSNGAENFSVTTDDRGTLRITGTRS